tara:strand:+ start:8572 stop:9561 length:990 start_codon:yes stop_codon:yes gene_type:complete
MFEYFYNEILRKTIIGFGTLFNDLTIKQENSVVKVPLAYGPVQKFLARLEQAPNLSQAVQISLPRMSFEFIGLTYDPARKVTTTQQITVKDPSGGTDIKKVYTPVPYNMQFELNIMTKLNDDALQIVEQILPYFQPSYNLTVNLVSEINEKKDVPIVLENVSFQDDYEGDYTSRRVLMYTLRFTAKTYLFGPVAAATKDIVKSVSVRYLAGGSKSTERDVTYAVKPRALKDYTDDVVTNLAEDITAEAVTVNVDDGTAITVKKYVDIDGEEMYVTKITGNKLNVKRGQDNTIAKAHVRGTGVKGIDYTAREDSDLIEAGDDFGFDGTYS